MSGLINKGKEWLNTLSPKQKQLAMLAAVLAGLLVLSVVIAYFLGNGTTRDRVARTPRKVDSNLLMGKDTKNLQMESVENRMRQMQQELDAIKSGKTVPGQDKNIPGTPGAKKSDDSNAPGRAGPRTSQGFETPPELDGRSIPPPPRRPGQGQQSQPGFSGGDMPLDLPGVAPPPRRTVAKDDPTAAVDPNFRARHPSVGGGQRNIAPIPGVEPPASEPAPGPEKLAPEIKEPEIKSFKQDKRTDNQQGAPGAPIARGRQAIPYEQPVHLPAGSIISGTLLTGMDAPTSNQTKKDPFPALLRVKHTALLPNRYSMDIRECFIIADGYGDMATERAYLRAQTLSCVRTDGAVIETGLQAYSTGPDGKAGIPGRLVSKTGALLARSLMAGFLGGMADATKPAKVQPLQINPGSTTQFQSPDMTNVMEQGIYSGASNSLSKVADYYLKLADQAHPVIEINAGQPIDFIIIRGTRLSMQYNPNQRRGAAGGTPQAGMQQGGAQPHAGTPGANQNGAAPYGTVNPPAGSNNQPR